jgi:putative spermidine/putrescine transport system permease protein
VVASAVLAADGLVYGALYAASEAFFYIAVMLPMWASYIVKAYAWTLLLAKDGVAQWFLGHLGLEGEPGADAPGGRRQYAVASGLGRFWCSSISGCRL